MHDVELVRKCLEGDQKACKQLYATYAPNMLGICHRYIAHSAEAEDALQDGFIKIFQNLHRWKQTGPLGAWIRKIIVNTCLTKIQSSGPIETQVSDDFMPELHVDPDIFFSLDYEAFEAILKSMPTGYRTVFNLSILEGYSYEEIASLLNIKEVSCRSQLHKAKQFLSQRIHSLYPHLKLPA